MASKKKSIYIKREAGPFTVKSSGGHLMIAGDGVSLDIPFGGTARVVIETDTGVLRQLADALTEIADEQEGVKPTKTATVKAAKRPKRPARRPTAPKADEPDVRLSSDDAALRFRGIMGDAPTKGTKRPRR